MEVKEIGFKSSKRDRDRRNYERYFGKDTSSQGHIPRYSSQVPRQPRAYGRRKQYYVPGIIVGVVLFGLLVVLISKIRLGTGDTDTSYNSHGTNYADGVHSSISYAQNEPSKSVCDGDPNSIPDYFGKDYVEINSNQPNFTEWDCRNIEGQSFSELDRLGRCGVAVAKLSRDMMPTGSREDIGSVKPSGWIQNKYPGIVDSQPPYLYNRSHLIAYALTGENANELNLITGTRYFNATTMLSWEEKVMKYLDYSDNHVLYRVTPYFKGNELLARGVEMEAYSVEDGGESLCFHVYIYNIQPGISLDYMTGNNWAQ